MAHAPDPFGVVKPRPRPHTLHTRRSSNACSVAKPHCQAARTATGSSSKPTKWLQSAYTATGLVHHTHRVVTITIQLVRLHRLDHQSYIVAKPDIRLLTLRQARATHLQSGSNHNAASQTGSSIGPTEWLKFTV